MKKKPRCVIDGCDTFSYYRDSQLCKRCYSRLYHQLRMGVSWMVRRSRQIESWQGGLQHLLGTEKITVIKPRRVARRRAA